MALFKRLGFRFTAIYSILYFSPVFLAFFLPESLIQTYSFPWEKIVTWLGTHVFLLDQEVGHLVTGSGDTTYDYILTFCYGGISFLGMLIWSFLITSSQIDQKLFCWLRVYLQLSLGAIMVAYGACKVIPTQFSDPALNLDSLLIPHGYSSPMGVLWKFMGTSPLYTIFCGLVEMIAGLLLFIPHTITLGTLLSVGVLTNIFFLNICYDVPVKLFSFHLLLAALFLLLPELKRLINFFILNRQVDPKPIPVLFSRKKMNQATNYLQLGMGIFMASTQILNAYQMYQSLRRPSPFYGIWSVNEPISKGPDNPNWRNIVFQTPDTITIQKENGDLETFEVYFDLQNKNMIVKKDHLEYPFSFEQDAEKKLILTGFMDQHPISISLSRKSESEFILLNRGFHWISEYPYYR
jgi:hypothetical protein